MKIIITENKVEKLKELVKDIGVKEVVNLMGGFNTFRKVLNINDSMSFLHLFDDLDVIQSEESENWTLFRYKKGYNLMVYDRKSRLVSISTSDIWRYLVDEFKLPNSVAQTIIKMWLDEVYNLRGVSISYSYIPLFVRAV
jgi:hypothetical protein